MLRKENYKIITYRVLAIAVFTIASFFACKQKEMSQLNNGYDYKILESKGGTTPRPEQIVTLEIDLIDEFGNTLDDSRTNEIRPAIKVPGQRSLQTDKNPLLALIQLMGVGDSAMVIVPLDSLPNPPQEFRQSAYIDYRIKVMTIEDEKKYQERMKHKNHDHNLKFEAEAAAKLKEATAAVESYKNGTLKGERINVEGGLVVYIVEKGTGEKGEDGELVDVHYHGFLKKDLTTFDNSYKTGKAYPLKIGGRGSIEGWLKGIPELPQGSKAVLDIPFTMGYGSRGNGNIIPPNADLLFYVNIDKVYKNK